MRLIPETAPMQIFRRLTLAAVLALAPPAAEASVCLSVAQNLPFTRYVRLAAATLQPEEVRIRYIDHSTYRIETAGGVTLATDYAGWAGIGPIPRVVTMNHAHETHWTPFPDERIEHVLKGWNPDGPSEPARHHLQVDDVLIRNVATNIRGWGGGTELNGNSIFIFEIGDLCIGHLGHLHHVLTPDHYAQIGRLDVVMAAVDGGTTLNLPDMIALLKRLRASVVLPMHYYGSGTLKAFLAGMSSDFRIVISEEPDLVLSARKLPSAPSVIVLPPS
jgi:L-ascorbate metabolism protein UlaG (beta-lactamase superfamily)